MAYPKTPNEVIREIKMLRAQGLTLDKIQDAMHARRDSGESALDMPGRNTIAKYMKDHSELDQPYEWLRLDEYGLPWEASAVLFEVGAYVLKLKRGGGVSPVDLFTPTARQARWWWRIYCAEPGLGVHEMWIIGFECAFREQSKDLLGIDMDLSDIEGYIKLKGWHDDHREEYDRYVEEGVVPPLKEAIPGLALRVAEAQFGRVIEDNPAVSIHLRHQFAIVELDQGGNR